MNFTSLDELAAFPMNYDDATGTWRNPATGVIVRQDPETSKYQVVLPGRAGAAVSTEAWSLDPALVEGSLAARDADTIRDWAHDRALAEDTERSLAATLATALAAG